VNKVKIDGQFVGKGEPCFIIAEAGSNHNRDINLALKLIDVAADAGADAVKFQNFKANSLYHRKAGQSDYLKIKKSIYRVIEEMEMPDDWIPKLAKYAQKKGIMFFSAPTDPYCVDVVVQNSPILKVASYELSNVPLVRYMASFGKPLILSTGAHNLNEISQAIQIVLQEGNDKIILMQCTASYPAPLDSLNLNVIPALAAEFKCPVGFSDHSSDPVLAPVAAVALGACCLEKHFTLDKKLYGPDHRFALDPKELKLMVKKVREAEQALGSSMKKVGKVEKELYKFARRSIFAIANITRGEKMTDRNIAVLRCGRLPKGLSPDSFDSILGKKAKRTIKNGQPITKACYA